MTGYGIAMEVRFADDVLDRARDRQLERLNVGQAPEPGELVNVGGYPYRVVERSWAYNKSGPDTQTFCYLRVVRW